MIALVTDSNSQLPDDLRLRYGITVVPLTVTVGDTDYTEGVDLDADRFYELIATDPVPAVSTSQPSPGAFAAAYQQVAAIGATEIISVHIASTLSGTLNSARIAAAASPVPVRLVDTGTASFGISCCVWEAAEALNAGASAEEAAAVAESVAARTSSVFILQALAFAVAGGRYNPALAAAADAVPVIEMLAGAAPAVVGTGRSVEELTQLMCERMLATDRPIRAAVCIADRTAAPFWVAMEERLRAEPQVVDLVRYRVGPSVGAHTGPGTAGGFWYPVA
jgi:DegV family protein with EDD domain